MLHLKVPGFGDLKLEHLVMDYNGTLAIDGKLVAGVREKLKELSADLKLHIITADTFGHVGQQILDINTSLNIIQAKNQTQAKLDYIKTLNPSKTVCIGNGRNDRLMLKKSALGILVIQEEGAALESLIEANIVVKHIMDALLLLQNPLRLKATLRN